MKKLGKAIKFFTFRSVLTIFIAGLLFVSNIAFGNAGVANAGQFSNVGEYQQGTGINKELYEPVQSKKPGGMYPYEDMDGEAKASAKQNAREVMNAVKRGEGTSLNEQVKNLSEEVTDSAQGLKESAENVLERAGKALSN